jgi:hypothetical protein
MGGGGERGLWTGEVGVIVGHFVNLPPVPPTPRHPSSPRPTPHTPHPTSRACQDVLSHLASATAAHALTPSSAANAISLVRSLLLYVLRVDLEAGIVSIDQESAQSMAFVEDNLHELYRRSAVRVVDGVATHTAPSAAAGVGLQEVCRDGCFCVRGVAGGGVGGGCVCVGGGEGRAGWVAVWLCTPLPCASHNL